MKILIFDESFNFLVKIFILNERDFYVVNFENKTVNRGLFANSSLLFSSVTRHYCDYLSFLVDLKNVRLCGGKSLLHFATQNNLKSSISRLIAHHKLHESVIDDLNQTPLDVAIIRGNMEMVPFN